MVRLDESKIAHLVVDTVLQVSLPLRMLGIERFGDGKD